MRLKDYFGGIPVELRSSWSPDTLVERINAAAGSIFWPFNTGVVGRARLGRIRLQFRSSFFEYNAKPVLVGPLRETASGSILNLRYRAPSPVYFFWLLWYLLLGLMVLSLPLGGLNPELRVGDWLFIFAIYSALLIVPLAMHYIGTRNSDEELTELLEFLAEHADARP